MIRKVLAISLVSVLALGCGGGGGGMPQEPDLMPGEGSFTRLNQDALLLMSDMYLHGRDEQGKAADFTIDTTCSTDGCMASNAQLGYSDRFVLGDFVDAEEPITDGFQLDGIGRRYGVDRYRASQTIPLDDGEADVEGYGAWMSHNIFGAFVGETIFRGIHFEVGFGMSSGNPSGSLPSMQTLPPQSRLTYEGVMLGVDSSGADRGEHLEGHARLEFRASAGDAKMDVSFTNIRGRSTDVSYEDVVWSDLGVEDNGTFDGGTINGAFYGSEHEEVGGAFSTGEIAGAYGARR